MFYRASIRRNGAVLGDRIQRAEGFVRRAVGLLGRSGLDSGGGLILPGTKQVHMFGMKFPLDLLFVSAQNEVLLCIEGLKPWRFSPKVHLAASVVELPAGVIKRLGVQSGDRIDFIPVSEST